MKRPRSRGNQTGRVSSPLRTGARPSVAAKIVRPRLPAVYPRARLFNSLDDAAQRVPVVWLEGLPGAGKTTLVASYVEARKRPCIWYQVDPGDGDVASLFHYLGLAVTRETRGYRQPLPKLTPEYLADVATFARNFFREISRRLRVPFVLVFDNVQEVAAGASLHDILREGLSELPAGSNAILISRNEPPEAFARLRLNRQLAHLDWKELQLREQESADFARFLGFGGATAAQISGLYRQCEGWVAGLILLLEGAHGVERAPSVELATAQTLFDYFATEIFSRRDPLVQEFLLQTALFRSFTVTMAERMTGNSRASALLNDLVRQHHFTERRVEHETSFQYHPLFQEFLLERAHATWSAAVLVEHQCRAAAILEAAAQPDLALPLYLAANDAGAATRLILTQALNWASAGRFATLAAAIAQLPAAISENEPWCRYWQGNCCLIVDPLQARRHFEHAYEKFRAARQPDGCYLSWVGIVESFVFQWDDFTGLNKWLSELAALQRDFPQPPGLAVEERLSYAAFTAHVWVGSDWNNVSPWLARAERVARDSTDLTLRILAAAALCHYYSWTGDMDQHRRAIEMARLPARDASASPLARLWALSLEALYYWRQGASDKARQVALEVKALAGDSGIHILGTLTLSTIVYTANSSGDQDTAAAALEEFRQHLLAGRRLDLVNWEAQAGHLAVIQGNGPRAEQLLIHAVDLAQELGVGMAEVVSRLTLARVLASANQIARARAALEPVLSVAQRTRSHLFESEYHLLCAWIAWHAADEQECIQHLRAAFTISSAHGFRLYWTCDPVLMATLCQVALQHDIATSYVRDLIRSRRLEPLSLDGSEAWPWPVKICTFGEFSVSLDDKPVTFATKAQKKPLELLKTLITLGGREVREDKLMEAIWPDAEVGAAVLSLNTTLHRLRRLVGEDVILRQDGRLSLDTRGCWVDTWAFERQLAQLEQACLRKQAEQIAAFTDRALALYRGGFLATEPDQPRTLSMRARLRAKLTRHLDAAAHVLSEVGRHDDANANYRRALEIDPLDEGLYRGLMQSYLATGRRAEALVTYERCRATLASQLGIAPSPETDLIARAIKAG